MSPASSVKTSHPLCEGLILQSSFTTALGTLQIMVGLFNIGLGPGRTSIVPGDFTSLGAAYWLGAVFLVTGILSILSGQFPARGLVGVAVFMNVSAVIFAVTGVVLYLIDLRHTSLVQLCDGFVIAERRYGDNCRTFALRAQTLLASMDITLIALALLQFTASVLLVFLGIRELIRVGKKEKAGRDKEEQQTQMKDVLLTRPRS